MAASHMNTVLRRLRHAAGNGDGPVPTDGQLLERFIRQRDPWAFETLVRRHGPMVLGVCRRIAGNVHDAEDAFQAAFLVLVRKARSIVPREMVGNWLYGVAFHTAQKAKASAVRQRGKERQVVAMPDPQARTKESDAELLALLDGEVQRLPDKYRLPVVLCELEGRSRKEVANQLHLPEGTLSSRLAKARKILAERLAPHGLALGAVVATAAVSGALLQSTVQAAALTAAGRATADVASANITLLTEGVLKTMLLAKLKLVTAVVLVLGVLVCGATAGWYGSAGAHEPRPPKPIPAPPDDKRKIADDAPKPLQSDKANPKSAEWLQGNLEFIHSISCMKCHGDAKTDPHGAFKEKPPERIGGTGIAEIEKQLLDLDVQIRQVEQDKAQLEGRLEQLATVRATLLARKLRAETDSAARTQALLDAKAALEKAAKSQPSDKTLKTLDEIEKLIQQMRKDLKDKEERK
jgi:RNA polymerase sigma factor (sigma-70 family)